MDTIAQWSSALLGGGMGAGVVGFLARRVIRKEDEANKTRDARLSDLEKFAAKVYKEFALAEDCRLCRAEQNDGRDEIRGLMGELRKDLFMAIGKLGEDIRDGAKEANDRYREIMGRFLDQAKGGQSATHNFDHLR